MKAIYIICVIALLGAIMLVTPAAATTWYVHDGESIWDTINGANDGDIVFVYNGTYGVFAINMPNITLKGEGADIVTVDCGGSLSAIGNEEPHHAPGCVVDGFKFVNSNRGIDVNPGSPDCIIRNCVFEGLSANLAPAFGVSNITFVNNTIANSTGSIGFVVPINGSTIVNNTIINGKGNGIVLYEENPASGGTIARNNIISNEGKGIWLYNAGEGNEIYLNNFVGNGESVAYSGTPPATIYWNSTEPIEYTHNGVMHTDYLGNYWDDYTGVDTSPEDGIGDTPYDIPPGSPVDYDYHPLMSGFENYPESHTPTPFLISGSVTYTSGGHVLDPAVTVTNLATDEHFIVKTAAGSNYYLTLTDSTHVTAGDTIRINASDGTVSSETDHPVTASDLETGGFVQDMFLEAGDRPDLTVTEKSEDWVGLEDRTYNVTYTVENIGGGDAGASTTSIKIDGVEVATDTVPALAVGENYTGTVGPFTLSGENDTIEVCSDIADDVDEPDELNNCLENMLEFPDMSELTVTGITTPENIFAGINNVISATVANTGDADSGAFNVSLAAGGSVVDLAAVTNIPAGNNTTVSFDWAPSGTGNHEICTFADCDLEVPEPDETNNELCENVDAVLPNPDLTIAKIVLTTPGYADEDNTLVVAVTNAGVLGAGAFTVSLSVDGTPLDRTVTQLAAGATTNLEYTWTPASTGAHTLHAEADTGNAVTELNESNNDFTRTSVIIKRTDWAQFHYDIVHTGFSPSGAPDTNETLWISDEISAIGGTSTVIADGMVFAYGGPTGWSGEDGALYCLDEFTGAILWNISIPTPAYGSWSSPAYHNGRVFTSTGIEAGCYNAATGEQIWAFENPTNEPGVNGGPVVADGKVIVNDWQAGHYYCLDEETGELLWTFAEGQIGSWAVGYTQGVAAYDDGKFYLTTWLYVGGNVYCVDADTGEEIWNQTTPLDICGSPAVANDIVYVTNYNFYGDGEIYAMDASDGEILWQQTIQRSDSTPAVAYGNVYITGGCKDYSSLQTYCFNAATGDLVWSTDAADEIGEFKISVAVADGKVFVGKAATFFEYAGTVALDAFTGDLIWSHPEGGSSPAVADGTVFTIGGGRVYAFYSEPQEPDLTVTAIETPANLRNDVINPITAMIENIGGSAAENFDVLLTVDGMTIDTQPSPILAAGENTTIEFLWTPSSTGNQTLTVSADTSDAVTESDESNNNFSQTVDVLDKLTVTANVRIEGQDETVWTGDVTFSSSTITASDDSVHYLNEPTALGALDEADKLGGFSYVVESHPTYGLYISEINNEPPIGWDGWMYRVNYVSPSVGAPDYTLTDSDEVLWYFGAWTAPPLAIELSATEVNVGEEFVVTVTAYNGTSAEFEPVNNATVYADGLTFQTGPDGNATLSIDIAGDYMVYADKGTWADYTRSERKSVNVATSVLKVDIGDYVVLEDSSIVAPVTVYGIEDYGTTTIQLEYDSSIAWVTSVDSTPDSVVSSENINNPAGIATFSAWNTDGVSGDVAIANVTLKARGPGGSTTPLNLTITKLQDTSYNAISAYDDDGSFTVRESEPPIVGNPTSSPDMILNDNGRARVPGTNLSTLSVSVTDNAGIASVTIDLTPIGGNAAAEMTPAGGTIWSIDVNATAGANMDHCFTVNATDTSGNSNTGVCIPLTVLIRGDVVRDGDVDIVDAYYIARYSVGLEPAPDEFIAGVILADSWDGVDIVDAYYIARHSVGLESAP